jgi:hypothetical protein
VQRSRLEVGRDGDLQNRIAAMQKCFVPSSIWRKPGSSEARVQGGKRCEQGCANGAATGAPLVEAQSRRRRGAACQIAQCPTQFFSGRPAKTRPARSDSRMASIRHGRPTHCPTLSCLQSSGSISCAVSDGFVQSSASVLDRWRLITAHHSRLDSCHDVTIESPWLVQMSPAPLGA